MTLAIQRIASAFFLCTDPGVFRAPRATQRQRTARRMSDELSTGLAATANSPQADTPATVDATLDAAFAPPPDAPAASDPSESVDPAKEPVAATQQPQEQPQTDAGAKGEPPPERWPSILENARTKAREEAIAEHRDALEIVQRLKSDFTGTLAQLLEEGASDPRFAESLTSRAAQILSARRKQAAEDSEPQPDAVTRYEDGTSEPSYSPAQMRKWNEWRGRQIKSELMTEFKPLLELRQRFNQHQQATKDAEQATAIATKRGEQWKTMPFFNEHKDAILQRQQALYTDAVKQPGFDPVNSPWELLQQAYSEVVSTQALPKLQTQQTEKLLASAAHKKAGSVSDPVASLPATPRKPRTPDEAIDQVFSGAGVS